MCASLAPVSTAEAAPAILVRINLDPRFRGTPDPYDVLRAGADSLRFAAATRHSRATGLPVGAGWLLVLCQFSQCLSKRVCLTLHWHIPHTYSDTRVMTSRGQRTEVAAKYGAFRRQGAMVDEICDSMLSRTEEVPRSHVADSH
jgi:hypothetical protein